MAHLLKPTATRLDAWEERDWDDLLDDMAAESVIPVFGSELSVTHSEGNDYPLYRIVAERLAQRLRLSNIPLTKARTINEVICEYLQADPSRNTTDRVYARICEVFQDLAPLPSPALKQLAEITHFKLFLTTASDTLMETAINQARFGGVKGTVSLTFRPREPDDLTSSYEELDTPAVYHVFGRLSKVPDQFVASEEDLLEFFYKLQGAADRLPSLFDALGENHLLFLGGVFSDWLARLFLRVAKRLRLSEKRSYDLVAGDCFANDPNLVLFLRTFANKTRVQVCNPIEFVGELHKRWRQRYADAQQQMQLPCIPPPSKIPGDAIFISYAHEDIESVRRLKAALDAAGLTVWFDKEQLMAGDDWEDQIERNLRSSILFLPVISQHTQKWLHDAYFRAEWNYADGIARRSDPSSTFIVPICVDDITSEEAAVPKTFRQKEFAYAPNGVPPESLVERLRELAQEAALRGRRPYHTSHAVG
jgi:TIR domain/SIR2-like domain